MKEIITLEKDSLDRFMGIERYEDLPIRDGDEVLMYVERASDGSGSSMGRGIEGNPDHLKWMINRGPVYSGLMGQVDYSDGKHLGLPISTRDIYGIRYSKYWRED